MIIERGEGIRVYDQAGRPLHRGAGGALVLRARLRQRRARRGGAASRWSGCPTTTSSRGKSHEPAVELAEKIKELAPGRMARVFYQSSGSEANDTQVKFAWYYNNALGRPKKKKIIAGIKGYHGVTIVAASLTGLPNNHRDFDLPVAGHPPHRDAALLEGRRARRDRGRPSPRGSPPSSRR